MAVGLTDVTMLPRKELSGEADTEDRYIQYADQFQSSMGQNLATLLAPEGITVNTVNSLDYGFDISTLTILLGLSCNDRFYRNDSSSKIRVSLQHFLSMPQWLTLVVGHGAEDVIWRSSRKKTLDSPLPLQSLFIDWDHLMKFAM